MYSLNIKFYSLLFSLVIFCAFSLFSQDNTIAPDADFTGSWATNYSNNMSVDNAVYLHIEKISENRYFAISVSKASPIFTYIGGGFIRDDGFLQITTDSGQIWIFTSAVVRGHKESISITNLANEESFGTYIRLYRKFNTWPFPEGNVTK